MRVTNNMISDQVLSNLNRSLARFMNLEENMSSGRRINKPSDDPIGTQKDLRYRNVLSEIGQYKKNISSASNLLASYDNILGNMSDILSSARELAVSLSNDTFDANARDSASNEAQSLFEQIIELANSQVDSRYIFSGYRTGVKAFRAAAAGVIFQGDKGNIAVEIEAGSKVGINLIGSDILLGQLAPLGQNADFKAGIDGNTLLADLNLGAGVDLSAGTFQVTDNNTGLNVTIDITGAVTVDDALTLINNQLAAAGITNLTVDFGQEGNNLRWNAVDTGLITGATLLSNLNDGRGVDLTDGKITIHNADDSINVDVDLTAANDIGDVINAINTTLAAAGINNVTAAINAAGNGIDITDTNGVPLGLIIDEASATGSTAADLRILGEIDPTLPGGDLNPRMDFTVSEAAAGLTTAADLGLLGDFSLTKVGDGLTPIITETTPLTLLKNGLGLELGQVKISQGNRLVFLDLGNTAYSTVGDLMDAFNNSGLDINATINSSQTGLQIVSTSTTASMKIEEVDDGRTAHNLGIFGSTDMIGSLMILVDALKNDDREVIGQIIGNLDKGLQNVLNHRGAVGSKVIRMETTDSRLSDLQYNFTKMLSDVEDADLTKLVTDLAMQENSYQAALIAASKIIQPSLLNFLK
ncbi:MAG: flagellar hook-associated protein 3 [candidate division Zixibacteria bacterium HGW-Zixibacteria-1]|nr:MAG: flagellar hook-associated protein 3 [candidate division Zixibacteria bacterium HGW-Zixibacteria-1]